MTDGEPIKCPECRYELQGLEGGPHVRCPECGLCCDLERLRKPPRWRPDWRIAPVLIAPGIVAGLLVPLLPVIDDGRRGGFALVLFLVMMAFVVSCLCAWKFVEGHPVLVRTPSLQFALAAALRIGLLVLDAMIFLAILLIEAMLGVLPMV